ncbi:MAG: hypothetical protein RIR26_1085 [Pseudomonadota bacterium]
MKGVLQNYSMWVIVFFLCLLIGAVHHTFFFPRIFHADAAVMQILGEAMWEEMAFLPKDFAFGNQLIFFRASPLIALASGFGFSKIDSFALGSVLSIGLWGLLLFHSISIWLGSRRLALFFTVLALIPLGLWDADYFLGQQSHLTNAIFSLSLVVNVRKYILEDKSSALNWACVFLFLMTFEAPMRGFLVAVPVLCGASVFLNRRCFFRLSGIFATILIGSFVFNGFLVRENPLNWDLFEKIRFKGLQTFFINFQRILFQDVLPGISSFESVAETPLGLKPFVVYSAGLVVMTAGIYSVGRNLLRIALFLINTWEGRSSEHGWNPEKDFIPVVGSLGVLFGLIAVAGLNPDSGRHFLWATFLIKIYLLIAMFHLLSRVLQNSRKAGLATVAICLMCSSWFADRVKPGFEFNRRIYHERLYADLDIFDVRSVLKERGLNRVFGGEFWSIMHFNTFIEGATANPLLVDPFGVIRPRYFTTRRSPFCEKGEVVYLLTDKFWDQKIEDSVKKNNGELVLKRKKYSIWVGKPVWTLPANQSCEG